MGIYILLILYLYPDISLVA